MAAYVLSDIHGQYNLFTDVLNKINLKDSDTLYVLGDVLDRGDNPIKVLLKLMEMPNAVCIVGNHELMAVECLTFLRKEVTDKSLAKSTIDEFRALSPEMQDEVIEFIKDFSIYEEITVNGQEFLLVHAGLGDFEKGKDIEDYSLHDLVWKRADYNKRYFDDKIVVSGHTPTQYIEDNPKPGYVYKRNNHIAIDCGAHIKDGRLACVCLDTLEEFYSFTNEKDTY